MTIMETLGNRLIYPFWDWKEHSVRLRELKVLNRLQWADPDEIVRYQITRLQAIMEHAYMNVPFYRERWARDPVAYPLRDLTELRDFPVVTKQDVREHADSLQSEVASTESLLQAKTGGSTGVALEVFFDRECQQRRNAAAMMSDSWGGWRPGMLTAALWGSPPKPKNWRGVLRRAIHDRIFFLDTMNLNPQRITEFHNELHRRQPGALFGHAHSLYEVARVIESEGLKPYRFKAIISTSMMLLPTHRMVIERVFGAKVTDRYGCEEVGLIASECEMHNGMHLNQAHVVVELPESGSDKSGMLVSDLNNFGMPLIRYDVGDEARQSKRDCDCGRGLQLIDGIVGRTADYLVRTNRSRVSGISMVEKTLTAIPDIESLQIVQKDFLAFTLNVVPAKSFGPEQESQLRAAIRVEFGEEADVQIVRMECLPKTRRGKSQFTICEIEE